MIIITSVQIVDNDGNPANRFRKIWYSDEDPTGETIPLCDCAIGGVTGHPTIDDAAVCPIARQNGEKL